MTPLRLRVRHKGGLATLSNLTSQSTLQELHDSTAVVINVPAAQLELKCGYPPKLLALDDTSAAQATLESHGIRDGDQILTSERRDGSDAIPSSTALAPGTTQAIQDTTPLSSSSSSTLTNRTTFAPVNTGASFGFGSAPVVQSGGHQSALETGSALIATPFGGLSTVDSTHKEHKPNPPTVALASAAAPMDMALQGVEGVRVRDHGFLVVREVKDDNSCLFNAIAYVLDPGMKSNTQGLRQIVASTIEIKPGDYTDAVLGKDYCDWIRKENSWGGAIELAIFSEHYKTEIDSIDVSTNRVDRFGQGLYSQRAIVMYSGIHYDAVALTPSLDIPAECDQTQFDIQVEDILNAGVQLAANLKKAHKYTDLATFTLRCSVCQIGLKGERDAQNHAQQTEHTAL
ncbi:ubiquitin-specific protease otu1 [Podila humilis]|nr:ubiquitin-specific protease otu1 [Podila humilis]